MIFTFLLRLALTFKLQQFIIIPIIKIFISLLT